MHAHAPPALIAAGLFVATLATRIPFMSDQLWAWDSVLYARALEDGFHVDYVAANQRPHPPGYLLYVAAAAVVRQITADSNSALVIISMIASALAVAALFLFSRRFASDRAAAFVSVGFALSPLVWHYSEVAYPYTLLGLLSIVLAASFAAAHGRGTTAALIASGAFGLIAGFRQDLLMIIAPLWIWLVWPIGWRGRAASAGMVSLGILTWLVPSMVLSGGALPYFSALFRQTDFVRATYSVLAQGLPALGTNLGTTLYAVSWGIGLFAVPVLALAAAGAYRAVRRGRAAIGAREAFLILWIAPALLFYIALHIGEWGYALSVLPGLYIFAAMAIDRVQPTAKAGRGVFFAASLVVPAVLFTVSPAPFSAAAIDVHDWALAARVAYVREHYLAKSTLLLAREDFLLVRYYLPEYRTWFHDPEPFRSTLRRKRAPNVNAIVVFTPGLKATSTEALRVRCAKDVELVYLAIEPGAVVELHDDRYTIAESVTRR